MSDATDTLRRAAKVLREHAEFAGSAHLTDDTITPRWDVASPRDYPDVPVDEFLNSPDAGVTWGNTGHDGGLPIIACWQEDADYIALVDPVVGLALADWLETAAEDADRVAYWIDGAPMPNTSTGRALATARAVLREDERHD